MKLSNQLLLGSFAKNTRPDEAQALNSFNQKYILTDVNLGDGNFAIVKKGIVRETRDIVAIKIVDKTRIKPKDKRRIFQEINILGKLDHPNIVKLYDAYDTEDKIYIVMEHLGGGELFEKIVAEEIHGEDQIRNIFTQICSALQYCHKKGIAHRDIKPQNILFTTDDPDKLKIIDFNLSFLSTTGSMMKSFCGSMPFVAPEIIKNHDYTESCDYWSLGVLLYVLASEGYMPFYDEDENTLLSKIEHAEYSFRPEEAWEDVDPLLIDLIQNLMDKNPMRRYGIDDIFAHPWITGKEKSKSKEPRFGFSRLKRRLGRAVHLYNEPSSKASSDDSGADGSYYGL